MEDKLIYVNTEEHSNVSRAQKSPMKTIPKVLGDNEVLVGSGSIKRKY